MKNKKLMKNFRTTKKVSAIFAKEYRNKTFRRKLVKKDPNGSPHFLPHQIAIYQKIQDHFVSENRGKLTMPCGSGKSFLILFFIKNNNISRSLILVTSIQMMKQFYDLCKEILPYHNVIQFSSKDLNGNNSKIFRTIYISTYHSCSYLEEQDFDFVFYDEAHRTVVNKDDSENSMFRNTLGFFNNSKKMFCTATEKIQKHKSLYYMDNEEIYGKYIYSMNFLEAIRKNIICDYRIIVSVDDHKDYFKDNSLEVSKDLFDQKSHYYSFQALTITNIFKKFSTKKLLVFCSSVKKSENIINCLNLIPKDFNCYNINNKFSESEKEEILEKFRKDKKAVLLNCKFFSEGVSFNSIDSVYFSTNKTSKIDIIQNIGRCLRKDPNNKEKIASIFICREMLMSGDFFQTIIEVDSDFYHTWEKKISYHSENVSLETVEKAMRACKENVKFIILKRVSNSFQNKIQILKEYEAIKGPVKQKTIYKEIKIGNFFSKNWNKYKAGVLPFEESLLIRETLSFKKFSSLKKFKFSFEERFEAMMEFEKETNQIVRFNTKYRAHDVGSFFQRMKKKYNKNKLTEYQFEKLSSSRSFSKWLVERLSEETSDEDKFLKLLEYEKSENKEEFLKNAGFSINCYIAKIRKKYKDGELSQEELEKFRSSECLLKTFSVVDSRSEENLEPDFKLLLEYENLFGKPKLDKAGFIYKDKNLKNIFTKIKNAFIKDRSKKEHFSQSLIFKCWCEKERRLRFDFYEKLNMVIEYEKCYGQIVSFSNQLYDGVNIYTFLDRLYNKFKENKLEDKKYQELIKTKTFQKWISERVPPKNGKTGPEDFKRRIEAILDYELAGNNKIPKRVVHNGIKIGQYFSEYKSQYKLGRMSKEKTDLLLQSNIFKKFSDSLNLPVE